MAGPLPVSKDRNGAPRRGLAEESDARSASGEERASARLNTISGETLGRE